MIEYMMKKDIQKSRSEESQINLKIEGDKLKDLIEKVKVMGGGISNSKSETHLKDNPSDSFSLRFNDHISLDETEEGRLKVTWVKNESFPMKKTNRQTEIVVIISEHVETVMMKFNFEDKKITEPFVFHETPKLNWWIIISMLNRTIEECIAI